MTAEDLLNTLEDLRDDEFEDFKWYLQQPDILEGYQAIKVSRLEKAERRDTVNVMVNTYKPAGALKVTKKVLEKINRNDLVQSLSDTSSGPRVSVDVSDVGETSGNRGTSSSQHKDHKTHDAVPPREEYEKKKDELEAESQQMKKKRTEVKQLSHSEDHLHLLQRFPSLHTHRPPPTKGWTGVGVCPPLYEGTVVRAVFQLVETLSKEMKRLLPEAELKSVQKYAVDVTLDPDTAHPNLILSRDGKQVKHSDVKKNLPNNLRRFSNAIFVLSKQRFSSGRFYFEVQGKGKTKWFLGVARESINRKGTITLRPQDGFWTVWMRNGYVYEALDDRPVLLFLRSWPQKVGVFVDYEEGLVSFYDIDAAALIYSFTGCSFTGKLLPFFCPGKNDDGRNSAALIISPVRVK